MQNTTTSYYLTLGESTDDETAANWNREQGREMVDLAEALAICQAHETGGTLRDVRGFIRGWIHRDGSYRLQ